jgi:hypothetical protein
VQAVAAFGAGLFEGQTAIDAPRGVDIYATPQHHPVH